MRGIIDVLFSLSLSALSALGSDLIARVADTLVRHEQGWIKVARLGEIVDRPS